MSHLPGKEKNEWIDNSNENSQIIDENELLALWCSWGDWEKVFSAIENALQDSVLNVNQVIGNKKKGKMTGAIEIESYPNKLVERLNILLVSDKG